MGRKRNPLKRDGRKDVMSNPLQDSLDDDISININHEYIIITIYSFIISLIPYLRVLGHSDKYVLLIKNNIDFGYKCSPLFFLCFCVDFWKLLCNFIVS